MNRVEKAHETITCSQDVFAHFNTTKCPPWLNPILLEDVFRSHRRRTLEQEVGAGAGFGPVAYVMDFSVYFQKVPVLEPASSVLFGSRLPYLRVRWRWCSFLSLPSLLGQLVVARLRGTPHCLGMPVLACFVFYPVPFSGR